MSTASSTSIRQVSPDRREGRLLSLHGFTSDSDGEPQVDPVFVEFTMAVYLAWRDFQERRGEILPHLPELLQDCDFYWGLEVRDTALSPIVGVNELLKAADNPNDMPFAIAGSLFSSVSLQVTTLASALEIPQVSGTSTSMQLEGHDLFARTVPTNAQDARAVMTYYHSLGVTRMATVFMNEPYGIQYNQALQHEADRLGITLLFFAMEHGKVDQSMQDLKESQARYVFAIVLEGDWQTIVQSAYNHGVVGNPDYTWMVPDLTYLLNPSFGLDKATESDIALAMHGLGIISLQMQSTSQHLFDKALQELRRNSTQLQGFIDTTAHPEMFANFTFEGEAAPFLYHHLIYDATMAIGMAACDTPGLFTGIELYEQLLQTEFEGLTGSVSFDSTSGTRDAVSTQYRVDNLLLSKSRSTETEYKLDVAESLWIRGDEVYVQWPFTYANNSTNPPLDLPPIENYDYHLIPRSLQLLGIFMGVFVIVMSLGFIVWTYLNQKRFIVSAAQPVFLYQLCVGCIVMALAIIPLAMQGKESTPGLNSACMSVAWLVYLGFVIAVSAVLAKTWRLEKVLGSAQGMQRVKVEASDVIKPTIFLMVWNITMLIIWTAVAPLEYVRTEVNNLDRFGRSVESYGQCEATNSWAYLFACLAGAANLCGVLFAAYKCYQVRNVTAYFSETTYLTWSMASLMETFLIGAPILVVATANPSAFFMAAAALICVCCCAFLIPIFVFKLFHKDSNYRDAKLDQKLEEERMQSIAVCGDSFFEDECANAGIVSIRRYTSNKLPNRPSSSSWGGSSHHSTRHGAARTEPIISAHSYASSSFHG